jgi:hypothetical protein
MYIGIYLRLTFTQGKVTIFEVGGKRVNGKLFNYVNHEYNVKCDYDVCVCLYIYMAIIVLKFLIYFNTCIKMNKYKKS